MMSEGKEIDNWWREGVIYHIYPQSFKDTNNDGVGDLRGIIEKLDYLSDLGITGIWISPIYPSPLFDEGYDISDYRTIHNRYGTEEDFNLLIQEAHQRNIRVIMDLVLNHTSIEHPWFKDAISSPESLYKDWYLWHPGKKGKRPNNWKTNFGRSAWTFHPNLNLYYYHSYFPEQPDLNWRNPKVKDAMFDIIKYWLDKGVDGFRLDVINMLFKHKDLPNNLPWAAFSNRVAHNRNQPEVYELLKDFRNLLDAYPNKTSIGEIYLCPPGDSGLAASFTGNGTDMLHMAFDFSLIFSSWSATGFYKVITNYYKSLHAAGWPCFVFSNHDLGRGVNHYFTFGYKREKAKILATLLFTLKGTPCIYYGDEIGMENTSIDKKQIRDRYGKMFYPLYQGRDKARTPMQWNNHLHAGFSLVTPWLPVNKNYRQINVETEMRGESSVYSCYKSLISLRNRLYVLKHGEIHFLNNGKKGYLIYKRFTDLNTVVIAINFSSRKKLVKEKLPNENLFQLLYSTHRTDKSFSLPLTLYPFEAIVFCSLDFTETR